MTRVCSIEGCERLHVARGYCRAHYTRWRETGSPRSDVPVQERVSRHVVHHGTLNEYYNYGCRCRRCKRAASSDIRARLTKPCRECGAPIWGFAGRTGLCRPCLGRSRRTAEHGTESRYGRGCRCEACKAASAASRRKRRATPNPAVHGTATSYGNGCRCDECRQAATARNLAWRRANPEKFRESRRRNYARKKAAAT